VFEVTTTYVPYFSAGTKCPKTFLDRRTWDQEVMNQMRCSWEINALWSKPK